MSRTLRLVTIVLAALIAPPAGAQDAQDAPAWYVRGLPGPGHAALEPLVGEWAVRVEVHGTLGRSPVDPPLVSEDVISRRDWVAGGRYLEDTTEGTIAGNPYWRRGWLGYSNMDRRYEWVTIDATNATMMIYRGAPGSGTAQPVNMSGAFTDQGVAGEAAVGKSVAMRTELSIESDNRHVIDLYFTPPASEEVLAVRHVYTRMPE
jgi:Protein of unknown function (DUF1579)